jgi:predicted NACHT family NTPase
LTGTQEYGKTYTAVHMLWEYFNRGYEPVWFKGGERKEERTDVRNRFANLEKYIKSRHIIYFEDPFGKTEFEVTVDEGIVRNIASIIETIENEVDDAYVIITSREEVFKEFKNKITAEVDLRKFEKKLSVKIPSYDYEKRREMLLKYAAVMDCKWREDEDLSNTVLKSIKDESKLPTPLNIEQFALATATTSNTLLEKDKLLEKIDAKVN